MKQLIIEKRQFIIFTVVNINLSGCMLQNFFLSQKSQDFKTSNYDLAI